MLNKRRGYLVNNRVFLCFKDMLIQHSLQRTISNSHLIISIRTFKRFGEYVKSYGHESKHYQGGISTLFQN
jgi:hypothetical protein